MDYAFSFAMKAHAGIKHFLLTYDIACQWHKKLPQRVAQSSGILSLPTDAHLDYAVGKFHLGAHIKDCFALHSLNFVKGSGMLDGELIETLWVPLNAIAGATHAMSKAHRQEVLDDVMNDSNWKKLVTIGEQHPTLYATGY